ncbi:ESX secretion-associated protein EspG [Nocardia transvalensis]|uniref:ESX secretion-associated protein EspG n=1 Tax=Nocardia transvalensis TaxID=37333 RepID=UPI0018957534|nr:ESX secretion-associated protein EspG [Nocardia transvalensis]MBF6329102.1 ESX secretion-associated protein EspG [Nocardia transvalensis]
MRWTFTPDEFTHVWATEAGLDRRPYPINLAPRGVVTTESRRAALRLEERYPFNGDPDLTGTLRFIARTDVTTITAFGDRFVDGERQPDPILALGVAFSDWGAAVLATRDTVTVVSCHARNVAKHLLTVIGSAPAGTLAPMREPREAVLFPDRDRWQETEATRRAKAMRRTLHRPIDARGYLTVTVLPEDEMSPPPQHRTWLDFTGDGRYVLAVDHDMTLTPVSDDELGRYINRLARIG